MHAHRTTAPAATRRVLLTVAMLSVGLVAALLAGTDAVRAAGPAKTDEVIGTTTERIAIKTHPLQTSKVNTFTLTFSSPGDATGWHSHPGPGVVTIAQGTYTLERVGKDGCVARTQYSQGDVFLDPGDGTSHRLVADAPGHVVATFITPEAAALASAAEPASC